MKRQKLTTLPRLLITATAFAALLGCGSESERSDSNSNWLKQCEQPDDCDGGYSCVGNVCLLDCSQASCNANTPECVELDERSDCLSLGGGPNQCLKPCSRDTECTTLGDGLTCEEGYCLPGPVCETETGSTPMLEAGAPSASASVPSASASSENEAPSASTGSGSELNDAGASSELPKPQPDNSAPSDAAAPLPSQSSSVDAGEREEQAPEDSGATLEGAPQCPALAEACPAGCYDIDAFPIDLEASCRSSTLTPLGCTEFDQVTDDEMCVAATDGSVHYTMSGTHADILIATEEFRDCTEAEWEALASGIEFCDEPADSGPPEPAPAERRYAAGLVNGTGCCDYFDVVVADPENDYCVIVSMVQEVGNPLLLSSAWLTRPADACELGTSVPEDSVEAGELDGQASILYIEGGALMDLSVTAEFPQSAMLTEPFTLNIKSLAVDGEWHPDQ